MSGPSGDSEAADIARAEGVIASWERGDDVPADALVSVAVVAEAEPAALDGRLQALPDASRRRLSRRLNELAAEGRDSEEACAELADRIEALADEHLVSSEQELTLLKHLVAAQPASNEQLASALGGEAPDHDAVAAWAEDAKDRGLIEPADSVGAPLHWVITEQGLSALGLPPARDM